MRTEAFLAALLACAPPSLGVGLGLGLGGGRAWAAEPDILVSPGGDIGITDYGTYTGRDTGMVAAAGTVEGVVHRQEDTSLLVAGDSFCARQDTTFGIRYRLTDQVPDAEWHLVIATQHPLLLAPSGRSGTGGTYTADLAQGATGYTGWTVRFPYEHVSGDYTFALVHNGQTMLRKSFHISFDCTAPIS